MEGRRQAHWSSRAQLMAAVFSIWQQVAVRLGLETEYTEVVAAFVMGLGYGISFPFH